MPSLGPGVGLALPGPLGMDMTMPGGLPFQGGDAGFANRIFVRSSRPVRSRLGFGFLKKCSL